MNQSTQNRKNRKNGELAQDVVMRLFGLLGFHCVERIETGWGVKRVGNRIVSAWPLRQVSGDIRAIYRVGAPGGVAVHCEVKYRPAKDKRPARLVWGDFEDHQRKHMDAVTDAGGIAIVAWVTSIQPAELHLLRWPINGMKKGSGIGVNDAKTMCCIESFLTKK